MQSVSVFLVICCVSSVLAQVQATITTTSLISITHAPSLPISGLSQGLIGYSYVSQLGGYTTWDCSPGSIWSTVGSYARCCTDEPFVECGIPTACLNTSLLVGPGSVQIWTCTGTGHATSCITGTVYDSISGTGFVINIDCYSSWSGGNWNATRDIIITSSSSPPIITLSAITTTSPAARTTPSSLLAVTSPPSQAPPSTSQTNPSSSKTTTTSTPSSPTLSTAAIAISLAILFAIAIATISLYIYRRRRRRRSPSIRDEHDSHDSENAIQQLDGTSTGGVAEADGVNSGGGDGRRGTTTTMMTEIYTAPTRTTTTTTEIYTAPSTAQTRTDGLYQLEAGARSEGTIFHSIRDGNGDEDGEVAL